MNSKSTNSSSKNGESIFSCKLYSENVSDNDNAILFDFCQIRVHVKCKHLNYIDYKYLQGCNNEPWYCPSYTNKSFHLVIWTIRIISPSLVIIILSVIKQKMLTVLCFWNYPRISSFLINLTMPFLKISVIQKM